MQMRRVVAGCLIVLLLSGCRSTIAEPVPMHNIVMMNSTGKVVDPRGNAGCPAGADEPCTKHTTLGGYRELSNYQTARHAQEIVARLRAHPAKDGKRRVLIFIHGGLNSGVGAIERAAKLSTSIENAGYYPIFINWNSALLHSYREHVFFIRQGEHWGWNPLSLSLSPFYFAADLARSVAKTPVAWFQMIRSDRESRPRSAKSRMAQEEALRLSQAVPDMSAPEQRIEIHTGRDLRTRGERHRAVAAYLFTLPTKLITVPIIDGLGANAWETLIRRARVLFHTDEEMSVSRVRFRSLVPSANGRLTALGGLSIFLNDVAKFMAEEGQRGQWEVTIVGHSMGTIVANEIIRTYANGGADVSLPIRNVVYLAAAASLRDYEDTIFPFLTADPNRQMYHLTLHRFAEVRDTVSGLKVGGADLAPRGSLLVWIDNYLSRPNVPLDRTAGRFVNLMTEVHNTPATVASQIHIREFDAGDRAKQDQPQHHGDFGAIRFWKEDCWKPATSYEGQACYVRALAAR